MPSKNKTALSEFPIPWQLVEALAKNSAIAFVGSGLSFGAGGPSWSTLLRNLAAHAEKFPVGQEPGLVPTAIKAIEEGRLINAATILRRVLSREELQGNITRQLGAISWKREEAHELLVKLPFRAFVTTNYDLLLEKAMGLLECPSYTPERFPDCHYQTGKPFLLYLHGNIHHPREIVLSWEDYDTLQRHATLRQLAGLLHSCTTLWLGYGHNDPDVASAWSKEVIRHCRGYHIVEQSDAETAALCNARGITPVRVESYCQIPEFLRELTKKVEAVTGVARRSESPPVPSAPPPFRQSSVISQLNKSGTLITNAFFALPFQALRRLREPLGHPRIGGGKGKSSASDTEGMFTEWAERSGAGMRIAVVSEPGTGKTVLLAKFAAWLWVRAASPDLAIDGLWPVIIYLRADDLREPLTEKRLWEQIEQRVSMQRTASEGRAKHDPLGPWRKKNAIYVLFDGIDEFGAHREGELDILMSDLSSLATVRHLNVFLTCRKVFWSQRVAEEYRGCWDKREIVPFTADELEGIVGKGGLGVCGYDREWRPKPGFCTPLIVSFVLALRDSGRTCPFWSSRSQLYEAWVWFITSRGAALATGLSPEEWFVEFRETALEILEKKETSVPPRRRSVAQCIASGILAASGERGGVEFIHLSLYEFFIAMVLTESFRTVVSHAHGGKLPLLPLARVDLDAPQSSVYGFLSEQLGDGYVRVLPRKFSAGKMSGLKPALARNLVEYAGMVYRGGKDCGDMADWLLGLIRNDKLHEDVRYNAARALERIHPWAPKPFFDYMSDWGDRRWTHLRPKDDGSAIRPWAIRAWRTRGGKSVPRRPGNWPPLCVYPGERENPALQKHVSSKLGRIILNLLREPEENNWILINCTFAWVRWYHEEDRSILQQAKERAGTNNASPCVKENLKEWVGHSSMKYLR